MTCCWSSNDTTRYHEPYVLNTRSDILQRFVLEWRGPSSQSLCGSWIYIYLCNHIWVISSFSLYNIDCITYGNIKLLSQYKIHPVAQYNFAFLFGHTISCLSAYLYIMKFIPQTHRTNYMWYLRFYYSACESCHIHKHPQFPCKKSFFYHHLILSIKYFSFWIMDSFTKQIVFILETSKCCLLVFSFYYQGRHHRGWSF